MKYAPGSLSSESLSRMSRTRFVRDGEHRLQGHTRRLETARSTRNICRAYHDGSVRFNTAGKIFASCDLFNGLAICSEYFELVPVVPTEMIVQSLFADDTLDSLIPVETPEHNNIPIGVMPFLWSGEYQIPIFPMQPARPRIHWGELQAARNFPRAG
jgi:hypothetical protein